MKIKQRIMVITVLLAGLNKIQVYFSSFKREDFRKGTEGIFTARGSVNFVKTN